MKKIILLLNLLIVTLFYCQKKFDVVFEADYKLNYKLNKASKYKKTTTFALLINQDASFFKNMNKYIADSLEVEKVDIPLNESMKYVTDFRETIGTTSAKLYVTTEINYIDYSYEEPNNINWIVKNEFKIILGFKCQKAETTKYGRIWTAWFTNDIPFQYGPYKFNGLPGLITELYDSKDDYHYTIYSFRKRKYTCKSANIATNAKKTTKEKIWELLKNKIAGRMQVHEEFIENKDDLEMIRRNAIEAEKNLNSIELSIY
ncbi:GLPGLI family protein [Chryseobacterium sp. CBTAP 102]|uniref:GLPGLI family protein n=1 Tax=Chryseobacterium sp. CBTAP 102 TaxID=2135644 RepID=UPI000D76DA6D|nr:GLPGLI family protein [Chryseobacterium sp. CBTAP 102]PXW18027.1 GLPGLI family protein [Chryseobacterium sp. CBTAP 102]